MGVDTKIQWAHHTFSPWRGCTKVSPGCANCYAETQAKRNPAVLGEWGPAGKRVVASESMWREPLKWDRAAREAGERRRVFCASMSDVFEDRPELVEPRVRLYHLIQETQNLDWLILTKRPENVARFQGGDGVRRSWSETMPRNVWLGVSVEDQRRADERIPILVKTPAVVRFLSVEPLLGPVDLSNYLLQEERDVIEFGDGPLLGYNRPLNWVIVGGESGGKARECRVGWVRDVVRQCQEAGVPCFVKQLGANSIVEIPSPELPFDDRLQDSARVVLQQISCRDKKGGDIEEFPSDLRVREFPA